MDKPAPECVVSVERHALPDTATVLDSHVQESDGAGSLRAGVANVARRLPRFRGKVRLCSWFDGWVRPRLTRGTAFDVDGVRFVLDTADLIDFRLLYGLDGGVSQYLVDAVAGLGDVVVWDVGANVGSVSLTLASRCPRVRVVAIEASPAVGRRLARNVAVNPHVASRIHVLHLALGDATGVTHFYESAETFNSGVGRVRASGNTVSDPQSVPMWRGDDLIAQGLAPPPDLVKIDIEGFEEPALRGLASHLAARGPHLVFEHEPYRLATAGNPPSPVSFLRDLGYTIRVLAGHQAGHIVNAPLTSHCDLVAWRDGPAPVA